VSPSVTWRVIAMSAVPYLEQLQVVPEVRRQLLELLLRRQVGARQIHVIGCRSTQDMRGLGIYCEDHVIGCCWTQVTKI